MRAVDVVTTSPAADAATVTIASAKELVDALVCAFCSSTAVTTTKKKKQGKHLLLHTQLSLTGYLS